MQHSMEKKFMKKDTWQANYNERKRNSNFSE